MSHQTFLQFYLCIQNTRWHARDGDSDDNDGDNNDDKREETDMISHSISQLNCLIASEILVYNSFYLKVVFTVT